MRTISPLRYPGGKSCLYNLLTRTLSTNGLERGHYAEPYAGGAGLALALLVNGHVSDIHINDLDPAIWSIWDSILNHTDEFLSLIQKTPITIQSWHRQKSIYQKCDQNNPLALGFAAFFLNRTNRSGIIGSGGVIGGVSQTGEYLIDCRFNKDGLSKRISRIAKYRELIHLSKLDALDFMKHCRKVLPRNSLLCIDPPYFAKGASLYTNSYKPSDHASVALEILKLDSAKKRDQRLNYIVTYDNVEQIRELYASRRQYTFNLNYSAQVKRIGTELLIASRDMVVPTDVVKHELKAVA